VSSHPPAAAGLVAVTGGTGFVGSALLRRLAAQSTPVRMLSRRPAPPQGPSSDVEVIRGDLRDTNALDRIVQGADVVFHLAAVARPWARDPAEFRDTNVEGTRLLAHACRSAGVRRLVHVSTNLVETGGDERRMRTEYQRTKREAESVVQGYVAEGRDAVIVRPTRVYGPGPLTPANAVTRAIDLYRRGVLRVRLADGDARGNFVFVDDVAEGLLLAASRGHAGAAYALGGANATMREFFGVVGEATGRPRHMAVLPLPLARALARAAEAGARLGVTPLVTRDWIELLAIDWPTSSERAVVELGYRPRTLAHGVRETVEWLARGRPE
jgi:farnesol dehydrogenase